jgi:Flp/Fap pilin component
MKSTISNPPCEEAGPLASFLWDETGATAIEYGLIAALGRDHWRDHGGRNAAHHDLYLSQHRTLRRQ